MKKLVYLWQCVKCEETLYSSNRGMLHCNKLVQWLSGIEGKGVNMSEKKVKVKVSGYIEIQRESLETIMKYDDPHMGLVYAIHMGYTNASNLVFDTEE